MRDDAEERKAIEQLANEFREIYDTHDRHSMAVYRIACEAYRLGARPEKKETP